MPSNNSSSPTRGESFAILAGSATAALSALVATWLANRFLPAHEVTQFLLFWATSFALLSIIAGVQPELTRAVAAVEINDAPKKTPAILGAVPLALVSFVAVETTLRLTGIQFAIPAFILASGVGLYAIHFAFLGAASGRSFWYLFASLNGSEALVRLGALALAATAYGTLGSLELAIFTPLTLWPTMGILSKAGRATLSSYADVTFVRLNWNILLAIGSSASTAVLMTGFPVLLKASDTASPSSQEFIVMGALILAISICRAPIMIPLQAFQGVFISRFVRTSSNLRRAFARPALAVLGIGTLGAFAAAIFGPNLFILIYPPQERAEIAYSQVANSTVLSALTFASSLMGLLVLSGAAALAIGAHRGFAVGWAFAAATSTVTLFIAPLSLIPRTLLALYSGPVAGCALHFFVIKLRSSATETSVLTTSDS